MFFIDHVFQRGKGMMHRRLHIRPVMAACAVALVLAAGCGAGLRGAPEATRDDAANKRRAVDYFIEGKSADAQENYAEAIAAYMEALQYDPESDEIATALARSFIRAGKFKSATYYTRMALNLNPDNGENWIVLQQLLNQEGDIEGAAAALEMYLKVTRDAGDRDINNVLQLAWYYFELGHDDQATKMIMDNMDDNSTPSTDMGQAADILMRQGHPEEAESLFRRLIKRDPLDEEAWLSLGQLFETENRGEDALAIYREGLEHIPGSLTLLISVGNYCLMMNDWNCAIESFEQVAATGADQTKISKTLAALYFYAGREDDANAKIDQIKLAEEDDAAFYFSLGKAMMYLQRYDEAAEYYRTGVNRIDSTLTEDALYNAFMGYAGALIHTDRSDRAIELVRDIAPEYIDDREGLKIMEASIYLDMERYDDAQAIYEWLVASDPQNIQYINALGHVYSLKGEYDRAIETLLQVEKIDPDDIGYLIQLSLVYDTAGQFKNAESTLNRILKMDPDNALALNNLAYMYIEHDSNLSKAIKMTERALELSPNNGAYFDTLAWGYFKQGKYDKAKSFIEDALKWEDPDGLGVIYDHYGDILSMLDLKDQAIDAFMKAMELGEDSERIQSKIDNLQ